MSIEIKLSSKKRGAQLKYFVVDILNDKVLDYIELERYFNNPNWTEDITSISALHDTIHVGNGIYWQISRFYRELRVIIIQASAMKLEWFHSGGRRCLTIKFKENKGQLNIIP